MEVKSEHPWNAACPISKTLFGMVIDDISAQLRKACFSILVTLLGIVYAPCLFVRQKTSLVISIRLFRYTEGYLICWPWMV